MEKDSTKQKIYNKCQPIIDNMNITEDKKNWMTEYAKAHIENNTMSNTTINTFSATNSSFPSLLPIAKKIAASSIGNCDPALLEITKNKVIAENRDRKIDSILFDDPYEELKIEDTEEYKEYLKSSYITSIKPMSGPTGELFYLDFKYDDKTKED